MAIYAKKAWLPQGWADGVRIETSGARLSRISRPKEPVPGDEVVPLAIPGFVNGHSHAFQRALAGRSERRSPGGRDNFWSWRETMYEIAGRLDADGLEAVARMAYVEMIENGYTTVAEFHYLHRASGDEPPGDAMFGALRRAAAQSGIRLCYLPVLYERAGFGRSDAELRQRRFVLGLEKYLAHVDRVLEARTPMLEVGIAAHSLRAVSGTSLAKLAARAVEADTVMHLHIAEQRREIDDCVEATGRRPVRWLLENADVDQRWCLVHATHMDAEEVVRAAASGAVVCLCPSTEGNLGDGLFPLLDYLGNGGHVAIGSDSHVTIDPFEELRWLEYGQRLGSGMRNVASLRHDHVGHELVERVIDGGARAVGTSPSGLRPGAPADLVVLRDDDPMLVRHGDNTRLDALVFSGLRLPIERVMVGGEWCVENGRHVNRAAARDVYALALARLGIGA